MHGRSPYPSRFLVVDPDAPMTKSMRPTRMRVTIEVDGRITKTNSPYVDGHRVTVSDVDFQAVDASPLGWRLYNTIMRSDWAKARALLPQVPGVRAVLADEVVIDFAPE